MRNEDEIDFALEQRSKEAQWEKIVKDESDLLNSIRYTIYKNSIAKEGSKQYRKCFLDKLVERGINYWNPRTTDDGKWHFMLLELEGYTDGKIKVGDRVTYPTAKSVGQVLLNGGVGTVVAIKPDSFGKSSRQIAVVENKGHQFDVFVSALSVVN
ncbi:hypothetical protein [Lactiplantibacillus herbarum]|uniref:hypothetical protein n=1 Tax=Lactiplantibacillus herbarum TaxID=1670446 RepID=UPI00064E58A1|nr:hypothetical protein [Lactiplantibacillus herbarum]